MRNVADSYQDDETVTYDCGPYSVFKVASTSTTFEHFTSRCQWNQTWEPSVLPICFREFIHGKKKLFVRSFDIPTQMTHWICGSVAQNREAASVNTPGH